MADPPALRSAGDPAPAAAAAVAETLETSLARNGRARLAVPGGSALAVLPFLRDALGGTWRRVLLTWTDERCVPFASPDSNRGSAYRNAALDDRDPPAGELPLYRDGESALQACRRVEQALTADFDDALDAVLLGLGQDGHIASLFPGRPALPGRVAFVSDSPKPPAERITLTGPLFATAARVVVFASGEEKRDACERLLARDPALPASAFPNLLLVSDMERTR